MKIAKLAVSTDSFDRYKGIGTFMIGSAERFAMACNDDYCVARFLTVDADIEHDEGVLAFYQKNGFFPNTELYNKNRKTISMRKDIYKWTIKSEKCNPVRHLCLLTTRSDNEQGIT